jgi:hypothetical protein
MAQVTVSDFGTRLGGFTDPVGDDNGPGSYVYPTNPVFVPGAFDLTALDVFVNGNEAYFVARIAGQVTNPFGGDSDKNVSKHGGPAGGPGDRLRRRWVYSREEGRRWGRERHSNGACRDLWKTLKLCQSNSRSTGEQTKKRKTWA